MNSFGFDLFNPIIKWKNNNIPAKSLLYRENGLDPNTENIINEKKRFGWVIQA